MTEAQFEVSPGFVINAGVHLRASFMPASMAFSRSLSFLSTIVVVIVVDLSSSSSRTSLAPQWQRDIPRLRG